jgi:OOP family OmpA-OmpF porin
MSNTTTPYKNARKTLVQSALIAVFSVAAFAPGAAMAQVQNDADDWHNTQGIVWKNSTGLCWHSGSWTPGHATAECEPELIAKAETPAPKRVEAAPLPAPLAAPKAPPRKVSFSAGELFDFDKAVLRPEGKASLDKLAGELNGVNYETILVTGHTDRIGRTQYNQKLSERRAAAVNTYLVSTGIPDSRTTSAGMGETQPITKAGDCKGPFNKKLIACLQADRRVDVEVNGSKEVLVSQ